MRVGLIARYIAETLLRRVIYLIHYNLRTNNTHDLYIELSGQRSLVSPSEWSDRTDLSIQVGLGNGTQDEMLQKSALAVNMFAQIGGQGNPGQIITPENIYNFAKDYLRDLGYENPDLYLSPPQAPQEKEPKLDPELVKLEIKKAEIESQLQMEREKLEFKARELGFEMSAKEREFDIKERELQLRQQELEVKHDEILREERLIRDNFQDTNLGAQ